MKKIVMYQCPRCGYISDKDYEVCPACNNGVPKSYSLEANTAYKEE